MSLEVINLEFLAVYILGAGLYGMLEVLWRGHTHWTMLLCGGLCFLVMYLISACALPLWAKCLLCAATITAVEFCTGCLVNLRLGWAIWDYSGRPLNILGQICPLFSLIWLFLSLPGLYLCSKLHRLFSQ